MERQARVLADILDRAKQPETNGRASSARQAADVEGRVLLDELLRGGIEPTPQLVEDLLYEGKVHSVAGAPGSGKTFLALYLAIQVMRRGGRVLYIDAENGPRLIAERLRDLGADVDTLDERFYYYPADLTLDVEDLSRLAATVVEVWPALAVFDSFADLIAAAGLEENSNTDCTLWVSKVAQPLKEAGIAVLILDHVPKSAKGPRGAGAKVTKVDVQWNLETTLEFDRDRTGELTLRHTKDRECWLPRLVRFSVGGGIFTRSAGTLNDRGRDELTDKQREAFDYIEARSEVGASWGEVGDIISSTGTRSNVLKKLVGLNLIEKRDGRYYAQTKTEPESAIC
jgi:KaiC/GvpD/RAD55 family RecA-like ATPase